MKSDGPNCSLQSLVLSVPLKTEPWFCISSIWSSMKESLYLQGCRSSWYHYIWTQFLRSLHTLGCKTLLPLPGQSLLFTDAPMGSAEPGPLSAGGLSRGSQGFCSVKALQLAPTQSFFPRRETVADFQQTDLQTHLSWWLSCQGDPWLLVGEG